MSTLSTANIQSKAANTPPVIKDLNGTECGEFCRARICFNGSGTVADRSSFNISSITDNAQGDYTLFFSNAMSNNDYTVVGSSGLSSDNTAFTSVYIHASTTSPYYQEPTTSSFRVLVSYSGTTANAKDNSRVSLVVFGD